MEDNIIKQTSPLINGNKVRFSWEGQVALQLVGDFNNWATDSQPLNMTQSEAHNWILELELPSDAYVEYNFLLR